MSAALFNARFHERNRLNLLSGMAEDSVAVLFAAPMLIRNGDVHFSYRQDSYFAYLTGFPEPHAVAVLVKEDAGERYLLFCRERDAEREMWDGEIIGLKRAQSEYGANEVCDISEFPARIASVLADKQKLYLSGKDEQTLNVQLAERFGHIANPPERMSIDFLLDELRLLKSAEEVKWIRHAGRITQKGFERVMACLRPGLYEYEIEAELMRAYRGQNATWAYPNIVAGGERALVLHYNRNDQMLCDGDLLLIDSGAEYNNYASDVSRTFPVNGRYSPAQRQIYDLVLAAQKAAIAEVEVGRSWLEPHEKAVRVLVEGLCELGIVRQSPEECLEDGNYRRYYPHRTSHWLGMDVHDVGEYRVDRNWRDLEAGMVFTVEPGLYLPATKEVPKEYRGIGVRIEDDVLVRSRKGAQILTNAIPSDPGEIEYAMRHAGDREPVGREAGSVALGSAMAGGR